MTDTVDTIVLEDGPRNYALRLTNRSDGTGESDVKKIDISTLAGPDAKNPAAAPTSLSLLDARWNIVGSGKVSLEWDATTDDEMMELSGNGATSFRALGGLHDPRSSGYTGDVFLTTTSFSSGDGYEIELWFKKKA